MRQNIFEVAESLPESKRKAALALMVRKWSPFPSTQFAVQWVGHRASVYAWDGDSVRAALTEAGHNADRCTIWPETFFRPPLQEGHRLATMADGVEGQVWKGGLLAATRWWPTAPASRDWATFLRASGIDLTQTGVEPPTPVHSDLLETPWTTIAAPVTDLWSLVQNERAAPIAAAIVAAPFIYYLAQAALLLTATMRTESALAELSAANQATREERAAAFANLDSIDSYLSLETVPQHFEVMNTAFNLLRESKVNVGEWSFDGNNLEILIQADRVIEAPAFIEMFEKSDKFSNVSGTVGNQQREVRLSMLVDPLERPVS